eukprot:1904635-Alexandrium_andersonii.AAC.1
MLNKSDDRRPSSHVQSRDLPRICPGMELCCALHWGGNHVVSCNACRGPPESHGASPWAVPASDTTI